MTRPGARGFLLATVLSATTAGAALVIIDGMNHVLKEVPSDRTQQAVSYGDPELPLAGKLSASILAFVEDAP